MSAYKFIKLKVINPNEPLGLVRLKVKFNGYADHLNKEWPHLSIEERNESYNKLEKLEQLIKKYDQ